MMPNFFLDIPFYKTLLQGGPEVLAEFWRGVFSGDTIERKRAADKGISTWPEKHRFGHSSPPRVGGKIHAVEEVLESWVRAETVKLGLVSIKGT